MSLPALYAQPTDDASWRAWAWNHQANHFDIVQAGIARQQTSLTLATNIGSLAGSFVMQFAATTGVQVGMQVSDATTPASITAGSEVVNLNGTEVQIGLALAGNVGNGDSILFSPGANVKALTTYQLSPIDPAALGMWLYNHQTAHNQINAVLGTQGFDLLTYDFNDPDQFQEFLQANGDEHVRLCSALGIG
jgi:hypothetical protein